MPFRVPKFLGEFNGKICSEYISYNLEFQNFHNHSFFLHLTISVDVIHHEYYMYSVSTFFRLIQYKREGMQLHFHISIAHWGFSTKVSDMARNMKMELHTFSLILYQSKKCGHRIHVIFMMYDVY
jgi:hypothetical protein